jgi:hypothetical protein
MLRRQEPLLLSHQIFWLGLEISVEAPAQLLDHHDKWDANLFGWNPGEISS